MWCLPNICDFKKKRNISEILPISERHWVTHLQILYKKTSSDYWRCDAQDDNVEGRMSNC